MLRLWRRCSDRASGLLIVHLSAAGNGMRLLADLKIATRQLTTLEGTDVRGFYDELLLGGLGTVCEERNATLLAFVTEEAPTLNPSTDDGWTEDDQWLWGLASASPFGRSGYRRPPTPGVLIELPRRHVLVTHHGVAMLGNRPDTPRDSGRAYDFDQPAAQSIYLDTVCVGVLQRVALEQISDDLADLGDPVRRPTQVRGIRRNFQAFRNRLWCDEITDWRWPDQVLRAYQAEHSLEKRFRATSDEIGEYASELELIGTQRTNDVLALLALLGLPAVVANVLLALDVSRTASLWTMVSVGLLVFLPALWVVRDLLSTFRDARHGASTL